MYRVAAIFLFVLTWSNSALAFENIEADAAYDRGIKEQIRKEFLLGLTMLKSQADGLGMTVREKDIQSLKGHMYAKAILMGRCVDKAITFKKTVSDNVLLDSYVKGCIELHMKFMAQLTSGRLADHFRGCSEMRHQIYSKENATYDFLDFTGVGSLSISIPDYVQLRDCYERCKKRTSDHSAAHLLECSSL